LWQLLALDELSCARCVRRKLNQKISFRQHPRVSFAHATHIRIFRPSLFDPIAWGDYKNSHMGRRLPFTIVYDDAVLHHVRSIERRHQSLIRTTIEAQLTYEPLIETRNRKPLLRETDFGADWELRFGPDNRFRVLYTVDVERHEVQVLAIGQKQGNRLFIGGQEVQL
jgi:mRNA-degrading endonuclease RelE of RelBE toxin-antitoxin system